MSLNTPSRSALRHWLRPHRPVLWLLWPLLSPRSGSTPSPFQALGEGSPGKNALLHRTTAALRHFALVTRALRFSARSPCSAAPSMRFLFIGSRFTLHASFPHSVTLVQLRFTSFAVTSLWRDLHPQECAHAGRTEKTPLAQASGVFHCIDPPAVRSHRGGGERAVLTGRQSLGGRKRAPRSLRPGPSPGLQRG